MKFKSILILSFILLGIIINSCSVSKAIPHNSIDILNVDSIKYTNYYTCEFKTKTNKSGYILINKSDTSLTSNELLMLNDIKFSDLCDVIEFQPNNIDITYRGHATEGAIYEDGELLIDLSNDVKKRYYQLCYGVILE